MLGEAEPAAERFRRALAVSEECAACRFGLGRAAAAGGDDTEAARQLETALELQPAATAVRNSLAQAYRRLGDLDAARRELAAVQESPPAEVLVPDPIFAWVRGLATGSAVHVQRGQRALSAGDLDEDSHTDIVVGENNGAGSRLMLLYSRDGSKFLPSMLAETPGLLHAWITDIDADRDLDIVGVGPEFVGCWRNQLRR